MDHHFGRDFRLIARPAYRTLLRTGFAAKCTQPKNLSLFKVAHFCKIPSRTWSTSDIDSARGIAVRKINITLIDAEFGEQTAQAGVMAL